ncbi:hypothetical protein BLOT_002654 [Blomia tropicalis]|nr:hypothetical protein BLOT_002654 [Blomia tropicalis]
MTDIETIEKNITRLNNFVSDNFGPWFLDLIALFTPVWKTNNSSPVSSSSSPPTTTTTTSTINNVDVCYCIVISLKKVKR